MTPRHATPAFAALRAFARERPPAERCDLCATALVSDHDHVLEVGTRRLSCACAACARLLAPAGSRWRPVPRRARRLLHVHLTDDTWHAVGLPINLGFITRYGDGSRVVATYPSAAGPVESDVALPAWEALLVANPCLALLQPDVEALLVNRTRNRRDHYLVSIDVCYRLAGLLRRHWRGWSGGEEVEARMAQFFTELDAAATDG